MSSQSINSEIGLFEAFGIEIELMLVDRENLNVKPSADELLTAAAGTLISDFEDGPITWSNELVSHVIEFKTTSPAKTLADLEEKFFESQQHALKILASMGARLMPTGMHPWMNPALETKLWAHDNNEIYSLYNEIFDCRGHGWSNLQSVHINLPFKNEIEFKKLHSAIRIVLPLLPALAASSPFADEKRSGDCDTRLAYYETNQQRLPIIAGDIIPPPVSTIREYRQQISDPIQDAVRPFDKNEILQGDWLNSRGAIARFDRGAIEIRLLDTQECPHADLTIVQFVVELIKELVNDASLLAKADAVQTKDLRDIYRANVRTAEATPINHSDFLSVYNLKNEGHTSSSVLKLLLTERIAPQLAKAKSTKLLGDFHSLLERPTLATRLTTAAGNSFEHEQLKSIYENLCDCLEQNRIFDTSAITGSKMFGSQKTSASKPLNNATQFQ